MAIYSLTRLNLKLKPILFLQDRRKLSFPQLGYSKSSFASLSSPKSNFNPNPDGASIRKAETLISHLKKCSTMKELNQIHAHIIRAGFEHHLFVIGKVIVFCAVLEKGDMDYAVSVFNGMKNPDRFIWNSLIRGFSKSGEAFRAFEYYKLMLEEGLIGDNFTLAFLMKACEVLGSLLIGKQMHCGALKLGYESHVFVKNCLIHMYGVFKEIEASRQLFDEIPRPELVAWNSMIECLVYCEKCQEALDLFRRMLGFGVEPDDATMVAVLSACSELGVLDFGRWVHSCIINTSLACVVQVNNALMDMYAKCGAIEEVYKIFDGMRLKNVVSWNTMILALASHGCSDEALVLFSEMLEQKVVPPDDVTFLGVLTACSHGGMLDEGRRYFEIMTKDYRIWPTIKHFGCMVDILGRAGFLEEAYGLLRSTPMLSNSIVWRSLLAACRLHGNVELAELVRRHLLEIEPDYSSDYVLLANTYASVGQWNNVMKVRRNMQRRRVHKLKTGNSIVDTSQRLYE